MNKNLTKIIIVTILMALITSGAHAYDSGDFQIWNTDGEDVKIGKDTKLTMEQEFRFGNNASNSSINITTGVLPGHLTRDWR